MSSEVKRYDPINSDGTCGMCVEDADYGAYVEYADYAAIEAECERLREVNRIQLEVAEVHGAACARIRMERDALAAECERLTTQNRITGTMLEASLHANEHLHAERNALRVELERFSQANRELSEKNVRRREQVRQLREALERATKLLSAAAGCATKMEPMPAQLLNAIDAELDASTAKEVKQ